MSFRNQNRDEELFTAIRRQDKAALQRILNEKGVEVLDGNENEWYPLHEAVDSGFVDIAKQIVSFATKRGVNVFQKWDQAVTAHSQYSQEWFRELFPREICPKTQTSFLRLAVRSGQNEMINFFIELYKNETKVSLSLKKRLRLKKLKISQMSRIYLSKHITMNFAKNQGIVEAILESVSRPKILKMLLTTFPDYILEPFDRCSVIQYSLLRNELESVTFLLPIMYTLHYDSKKAGYNGLGCLMTVAEYCLKWTFQNNDTKVLKMLIEAAGGKNVLNSNTTESEYTVMYFLLYYSCCYGTVMVVNYLVDEVGLDVYKECSAACVAIMRIRKKTNFHRMQPFDITHAYYLRQCSCDPPDDDAESSKSRNHISALFWAALENNIDVLNSLLKVLDRNKFYRLHFCCAVMSQYIAVNSLHKPLLLLYEAGFCIDTFYPQTLRSRPFIECSLYYNEKASMDTLKVLLKYGAVELTYGKDNSMATIKQALEKQWHIIVQVLQGNLTDQTEDLESIEDKNLCLDKFDLLLQHVGLFKLTRSSTSCRFEQTVPSLKQHCRFLIRCCIVRKAKTLNSLRDLPLPSSLINYLFVS